MSYMDDIKRLEEIEVQILRRHFAETTYRILIEDVAEQFLEEEELKEYKELLKRTDAVMGMYG